MSVIHKANGEDIPGTKIKKKKSHFWCFENKHYVYLGYFMHFVS